MALVFDQPSKGPGTHALIVGVEDSADSQVAPFSAVESAGRIADWILSTNFVGAPLASVDVLASETPGNKGIYLNMRDGSLTRVSSPRMAIVQKAILAWLERLDSDPANVALFYFVGPTIESASVINLVMDGRAGRDLGKEILDFGNLWSGMRRCAAERQLCFIDGCRSEMHLQGEVQGARLFQRGPADHRVRPRAFFVGRTPEGPATGPPGRLSCLADALLAVLGSGDMQITARQLAPKLDRRFGEELREAGFSGSNHVHSLIEVDFDLHFKKAATLERDAGRDESRLPAAKADAPAAPGGAQGQLPTDHRDFREGRARRDEEAGESGSARSRVERSPQDRQKADEAWRSKLVEIGGTLTDRQRQCLRLVQAGLSSKQIAATLGIAPRTVDRHIQMAMRAFDAPYRHVAAQLFADAERWRGKPFDPPAPPDRIEPIPGAAAPSPAVDPTPAEPRKPTPEPNTHFVSDDPEVERDALGRGPLAIALARRLHRIWCRSNAVKVPGGEEVEAGSEDRAAFVLHLDAPWGGGKTSFANFLARVLNPFPAGCKGPAQFLAERAGGGGAVGTIFIDDPPADGKKDPAAKWPEEARRPWIMVPFNAWQAEHCAPPWWVFYQAIRKGCFRAIRAEGRRASEPTQAAPLPASAWPKRLWAWSGRLWAWTGLWGRELGWRLRNPKIIALLVTAGIAAALFIVLTKMGIIFGGEDGPAFDAGNALGFLLAGVGGVSGLWALGALLTETVAPGTDAAAERRSLGGGDPFDRFRRHFAKTMEAVKRPVMVIVDDLDRCRPDFVVDLIRGIQTLLRSPRVVFVILGDRDWIERAFEAHHDAMKKVDVGAEQTFGARFVEKAIQMSFILPEMPETRQDLYVRRVLLGPGAGASGAAAAPPPADLSQQLRADYRQTVARAGTAEKRKEAEQDLRDKYRDEFLAAAEAATAGAGAAPSAPPDPETAGAQADKLLGEERAMLAAVDERMGKALLHRLEPLARAFPANPRQIKRIVNAITMYTCVAYLQMDMDETDERGVELAIWVILMTEWPATWRLLAGCPDLLTAITAGKAADAKKALRAVDATLLPGTTEATLEEIMRVRADARLRALIEGDAATGAPALTLASVREFRSLTPLYAGKRRLAAEAASGETKA